MHGFFMKIFVIKKLTNHKAERVSLTKTLQMFNIFKQVYF